MGVTTVLLVLIVFGQTYASFVWEGGDWEGRDFSPANGDVLSGSFTNVGRFLINESETIFAGSGLVSLMTYETVINGVFYGGPALSPALHITSDTTLTLNGALDQWSSVVLAAGTAGSVTIATGGDLDLDRKGSDIFLQGPGGVLASIGEGSITLSAVPLPSALFLFAPGLAGILLTRTRSRKGGIRNSHRL
jgi:hypothetical protein